MDLVKKSSSMIIVMAKMNHNNDYIRHDHHTNTAWSIDHNDATAAETTTSLHEGSWKCVPIIFVRHGIALHNVIQQQQQQQHAQEQQLPLHQDNNNKNNSSDDDEDQLLFDSPLTRQGKFQAVVIGETIYNYLLQVQQQHHHVQQRQQQVQQQWNLQIITSPLTRCLQTSMYAFGIPPITTFSYHDISSQMNTNHTNTSSSSSSSSSSSFRTNAVRNRLHCHPTIICHEQLREAHGIYVCDKRRTRTQLQQIWSSRCTIQYIDSNTSNNNNNSNNSNSNNYNNTIGCYEMTNEDKLWQRHVRETIYELQIRIYRFLSWLVAFASSSSNDPNPTNTTATYSSIPLEEATTITDSRTNSKNATIYIVVSHGVWIETMLQMYDPTWSIQTTIPSTTTTLPTTTTTTTIGGIHPSSMPSSSSSPPPPPPTSRRIYNGDMYYCDCYCYHQPITTGNTNGNETNIQLQNVHQIPPLSNY